MLSRKLRVVDEKNAPDGINLDALQLSLKRSLRSERADSQRPRPDIDAALALVSKASNAIDLLEKRSNDVEAWAFGSIQRLRDELAAANSKATIYEDRARQSEQRVRDLERQAADLQQRVETAHERLAGAEARSQALEKELKKAEAFVVSAEARAARAQEELKKSEAALAQLERHASQAEEWAESAEASLAKAHDKIMSSLSNASGVLARLGSRTEVLADLEHEFARAARLTTAGSKDEG